MLKPIGGDRPEYARRFAPPGGGAALMGILNITPDSFSDGGKYFNSEKAIAHGRRLAIDGANLIDIGGESTRPGSAEISADEEIRRVVPVIRELRNQVSIPLSIDTQKTKVARAAIEAGAVMLNDVSGLRRNPDLARVAAEFECDLALNHMRGTPATMQDDPRYDNVVPNVYDDLAHSVEIAVASGVSEDKILIDPGIGFGKRLGDNLALLRNLSKFRSLGFPVLVGPSRKSFLGMLLDLPVEERLDGTIGACVAAVMNGADMLRIHDVLPVARAICVVEAIERTEER